MARATTRSADCSCLGAAAALCDSDRGAAARDRRADLIAWLWRARLVRSIWGCGQRAGVSSRTSGSSTATSSCRRSGSRRCSALRTPSPSLGLVGGRLVEPTPQGWQLIPIPDPRPRRPQALPPRVPRGHRRHPRAARLGHDRRDLCAHARLRDPLPARARRPPPPSLALGRRPPARRARHGECAWILHQSLPWALLRSVKVARVRPAGSPAPPSSTATCGSRAPRPAGRRPAVPPLRPSRAARADARAAGAALGAAP